MARTLITLNVAMPKEQAEQIVLDILKRHDFSKDAEKNMWQKGLGVMVAPSCLEARFIPGQVRIEAFLKTGVGLKKEMALSGFYGWAVKAGHAKFMREIFAELKAKDNNSTEKDVWKDVKISEIEG